MNQFIVDAGLSAKSLGRPGIEELFRLVQSKRVATVVVLKVDRLTRSVGDLTALLTLI